MVSDATRPWNQTLLVSRIIAALGVVAGALGGWIEKPANLEVSGDAWVSGDAREESHEPL